MKQKKQILFIFIILFASLKINAQVSISDSSAFVPMFSAFYSYQIPGGDIAKRFGNNSVIGGDFKIKTKKNWVFGVDFNYIFGDNIKNHDSVFKRFRTDNGEIIDGNGIYASWQIFERGFYITAKAGRVFSCLGHNPNSGLLIMGSAGYLQHNIRIEVENKTVPQLWDDYKKGYDRLTGGFTFTEFIGYLFMGDSKIVNFYIGFEFVQAWTKDLREYNFDDMEYTNNNYFDLLYGIKVGWFIPVHKRVPKEYYYD